jgi:hypothetical protein
MRYHLTICALLFSTAVFAQTQVDVKSSIDWTNMELKAQTMLNLASANIKLPSGRVQAEDIIEAEYPRIIRPIVMDLPVDSSRTLGDLLYAGEITLISVDSLSRPSKNIPPALSADLVFLSASYAISLKNISEKLGAHSRSAPVWQPLTPVQSPAYTGIVIIANEKLPVHGRNSLSLVQPCLFPKIWDSDMNLIYDKNVTNPNSTVIVRYVSADAIFRATPSGMDKELEGFVGPNPLRIIAKGAFGVRPTDPIIDKDDALLILSSEANLKLLGEARIVIVLDADLLMHPVGEAH